MTTDASGNIYVVGAFTGILDFDPGASVVNAGPAVGSDIWFGKYNSTGSLVWAKALIGGDDDFGRDIVLDNSGNIYITGYFATQFPLDFDPGAGTAPPSVPKGLFFAKYNNSGAFQWVKTIGATSANGVRSHAIALDASGNCYLAGQMSSSQAASYDFDPGAGVANLSTANGSVFYAKYTSLGNYVWAKNVGPANTGGEATDLSLDASGNVHITGSFVGNADFHPSSTAPVLNSANGGAFVCKYNSSGNYVWSTQVTGGNGDRGMALVTDATNNVFVTGSRNANGGNAFLARFSSLGSQTNLLNIGSTVSIDAGQSLKMDGSNIYMGGYFSGSNVNFNPNFVPAKMLTTPFIDFFVAKYATSDLSCYWARNYDLQLTYTDFEINAIQFAAGKVVAAGNFRGSGDFTTCGPATVYNATTLDAFLVGYTLSDPALAMSGPDFICSPGEMIFTVGNIPIGATVTWTVDPPSWVSSSTGTGPSFTTNLLPGVGPGTLTITGNVSGLCGGPLYKVVAVGLPNTLCTPSIVVIEPCATLQVTTCTGGLSIYNWFIDDVFVATSPNNDAGLSLISNPLLPGNHTLCVTTENGCGPSAPSCTNFVTGDCSGGQQFMMGYPNPAHYEILFTMEAGEKAVLDYNYSYELRDKTGNLIKAGITNRNSIVIDVRDIPRDTYLFEVRIGKQLIQQRILLN